MNNKRKGIFIAILVVQLLLPIMMCIGSIVNQLVFEKNAQEVKVSLDSIIYDPYYKNDAVTLDFSVDNIEELGDYWIFYPNEQKNGFYCLKQNSQPQNTDLYYYSENDGFSLEMEYKVDKGQFKTFDTFTYIYSKENERWNLNTGKFLGEPTEAYAVLKVRNGECKLTDVYVCGYEINDFVSRYNKSEFSLDVYSYNFQ